MRRPDGKNHRLPKRQAVAQLVRDDGLGLEILTKELREFQKNLSLPRAPTRGRSRILGRTVNWLTKLVCTGCRSFGIRGQDRGNRIAFRSKAGDFTMRYPILCLGCLLVVAMMAGCRQHQLSGCAGGSCGLRSASVLPGANEYSSEIDGVLTPQDTSRPRSSSMFEGSGSR